MTDAQNTLAMTVIACSILVGVTGMTLVASALYGILTERLQRTGSRCGESRQEVCRDCVNDSHPNPAEPDCGWFSGR